MTTLFYLPIEPLVERYTESWYTNIPKELTILGISVHVIDGKPLSSTVEVGTFLDINSTVAYKATQMQEVARLFYTKQVHDGDTFFVADIEFWGSEAIKLLASMNGININLTGFLHAASYTLEDAFSVASPYQKYTELGWLAAYDRIFVGSNYHKTAIFERRIAPYAKGSDQYDMLDKIHVTGNPIFLADYASYPTTKRKKLILSNRFDWEKRPNLSLDFAQILKSRNPDLEIVVTTSRETFRSNKKWLVEYAKLLESNGTITIKENLTKAQYHTELSESTLFLTNSIEESFGYCVIEACVYDVQPLMPNTCSHPELVEGNQIYLFDDMDEIIEKAEFLLNNPTSTRRYADKYLNVVEKWIS